MLHLSNIAFQYDTPVLRGLSFDVGDGELFAVLGPNGSGKSTLLKIVAGILPPSSGSVRFDRRDINSMTRKAIARLIGYVPQESSVRFPLTALEFVLQGRFAQGRVLGFESEEDARAASWSMEITGTDVFARRLVSELSGGERQRVMLARALAGEPKLLVLDEPVANLDIAHQVKLFELLRTLVAGGKMAAMVVTHELNLASDFADRVLMLKSGNLAACGSPRDVMSEAILASLFETSLLVDESPVTGSPRITPRSAVAARPVSHLNVEETNR
jgi:iron complex transport system ATP-binding protein